MCSLEQYKVPRTTDLRVTKESMQASNDSTVVTSFHQLILLGFFVIFLASCADTQDHWCNTTKSLSRFPSESRQFHQMWPSVSLTASCRRTQMTLSCTACSGCYMICCVAASDGRMHILLRLLSAAIFVVCAHEGLHFNYQTRRCQVRDRYVSRNSVM